MVRRIACFFPIICLGFLVFTIIMGILFTPYDPYEVNTQEELTPPSSEHWFGTDHLGRDVLTRIVFGASYTLLFPAIVLLLSSLLGVVIGLISTIGRKVDLLTTAIMDSFSSIPSFLVAIIFAGLLGPGMVSTLFAILVSWWVHYARIVRNTSMIIRNQPFILSAQLSGTFGVKLIRKHIFPNALPIVRELIFLDMGTIILMISSLSFLGLGAQPPIPDWGGMILDGKSYIQIAPWVALIPSVFITIFVMLFYFMGRRVQ
ncbi:ABC transporter permease [Virgibacillus chiguensis]|uniref:Peptide/nickel transport system permease protein n=1 Tax=Virgibacillus chiguensis TaxID=411959 RepID=A0A1M5MG38_9BACI|nr:ABC transporter permease [Virgibacillus chiguensis]SHG75673.1 peptide/nickel transport system permease protein [Virgibacillus chiguensis]